MAIDKGQQARIKDLLRHDGWDALTLFLLERISKIQGEEVTGNNDFETLRALHKNQGKVEGLKDFFNDVERMSFDN